jgi:hypothetical protein
LIISASWQFGYLFLIKLLQRAKRSLFSDSCYVKVNQRGIDIFMSEKIFEGKYVSTHLEQVGGIGMT